MRLLEIGEEKVIHRIVESFVDRVEDGVLNPGEDARDFKLPGIRGLISIDGYNIKSVKLPWRNLSDIGWCAVTSVVSDIICKGGYPFVLSIALGVPKNWEVEFIDELMLGVKQASKEYGVKLLCGDTNESSEPWIVASAIGYSSINNLPSRSNAKPGDYIIATNYYGAMGVVSIDGLESAIKHMWIHEYTKRPKVSLKIAKIINEFPDAIHASMDVSDGLGYTIYSIANYSKVSIKVYNKPQHPKELIEYSKENNRRIWDYILFGGEEYGVVLSIDSSKINLITNALEEYKVPYEIIGEVVDYSDKPIVNINGYGRLKLMRWDQFKGWIKEDI